MNRRQKIFFWLPLFLLLVSFNALEAQKQAKCWTPFPYELSGKIKRVHVKSEDLSSTDYKLSENWEGEWWFDEQGLMTNSSSYADRFNANSRTKNYRYVYNDKDKLIEQWESFGRHNKKYEIRYSYYYNEDYSQAEIIDEKKDNNCKFEYYNTEGQITGKTLCGNLEKSNLDQKWVYKNGQKIRYEFKVEDGQNYIIEFEYDEQKRLTWEGTYTSNREIVQNAEYVYKEKDNVDLIRHYAKMKNSGKRKWEKKPYRFNYRFFRDAYNNIIRSEVRAMGVDQPYLIITYDIEYYE